VALASLQSVCDDEALKDIVQRQPIGFSGGEIPIFDGEDPTMLAPFREAMHSLPDDRAQARRSHGFQSFPPPSGHRRRIGCVRHRALQLYGALRATLFYLPHVATIAAGKIAGPA
jgi:hypothetical protein